MNFTKATIIKRKLADLAALIYEDRLEIPQWETRHATFLGEDGYTDSVADAPIRVGERWTCRDDFTRWFSADVTVPESFSGKPLALDLEFGGEGIVRVNGGIVSAITSTWCLAGPPAHGCSSPTPPRRERPTTWRSRPT